MKLSYDPAHNVAYLSLREVNGGVETVEFGDDVLLDVGPDGELVGIELLNANEQLSAMGAEFQVINESSGSKDVVKLAV